MNCASCPILTCALTVEVNSNMKWEKSSTLELIKIFFFVSRKFSDTLKVFVHTNRYHHNQHHQHQQHWRDAFFFSPLLFLFNFVFFSVHFEIIINCIHICVPYVRTTMQIMPMHALLTARAPASSISVCSAWCIRVLSTSRVRIASDRQVHLIPHIKIQCHSHEPSVICA